MEILFGFFSTLSLPYNQLYVIFFFVLPSLISEPPHFSICHEPTDSYNVSPADRDVAFCAALVRGLLLPLFEHSMSGVLRGPHIFPYRRHSRCVFFVFFSQVSSRLSPSSVAYVCLPLTWSRLPNLLPLSELTNSGVLLIERPPAQPLPVLTTGPTL